MTVSGVPRPLVPTPAGHDGAVTIEFQAGTKGTMTIPGGPRTTIKRFAY